MSWGASARSLPPLPPAYPPFKERWPWRGADLQTLRNTLRRVNVPLPSGAELVFPMDDGSGDHLTGILHAPASPAASGSGPSASHRPLVILLHGLAGSADSVYVRATAATLLAGGYAVLRLNLRGAGPLAATSRHRYHAGRTDDIRAVIRHLAAREPLAAPGIAVVGYSLAGNMVLKLMGEPGLPPQVRAAASVSAPIDLAATSRQFLKLRNRPYHLWLLSAMKQQALAAPRDALDDDLRAAVRACRTVYEFDDRYVAPLNGWRDAQEYYQVNSAVRFLPAIQRPTLVIHALNDPWISAESYCSFAWINYKSLYPLMINRGGHVGFHGVDGLWGVIA